MLHLVIKIALREEFECGFTGKILPEFAICNFYWSNITQHVKAIWWINNGK